MNVTTPAANAKAMAQHAVVLAHITACHSPEKTVVAAVADGIVSGKRISLPVAVRSLSTPGDFAVARDWPHAGSWRLRFTVTNADYKNYATGVILPV